MAGKGQTGLNFVNTNLPQNINKDMLVVLSGVACETRSGDHDLIKEAGPNRGRMMVILYKFENDAHVRCEDISI